MESDAMRESIILYANKLEPLEDLTLEERGIILTAIMAYMTGKEAPEMDRTVRMAWRYIDAQLKLDSEKYEDTIRAARSEAGKKGAAARWGQNGKSMANEWQTDGKMAKMAVHVHDHVHDNDHDHVHVNNNNISRQSVSESDHVSVSNTADGPTPTEKDVTDYAASLGFSIDAAYFLKYYTRDGRLVANGEPVRDWRALVRSWWKQEQKSQTKAVKKNAFQNFDQRADDLEADFWAKHRAQYAKWTEGVPDG